MTDSSTPQVEDGVWDRLRRRKVVQWGVLYVAGAWGFLQGLEYVANSFHWPDQVRQIAILALAARAGFELLRASGAYSG